MYTMWAFSDNIISLNIFKWIISARQMTWQNLAKPDGLYLTEDDHELRVTESGNYFLYATMQFVNHTYRFVETFCFFLSRKSRHVDKGLSIEHIQKMMF